MTSPVFHDGLADIGARIDEALAGGASALNLQELPVRQLIRWL
jgi:hypothetical protein